jgi:hypothetical protein
LSDKDKKQQKAEWWHRFVSKKGPFFEEPKMVTRY